MPDDKNKAMKWIEKQGYRPVSDDSEDSSIPEEVLDEMNDAAPGIVESLKKAVSNKVSDVATEKSIGQLLDEIFARQTHVDGLLRKRIATLEANMTDLAELIQLLVQMLEITGIQDQYVEKMAETKVPKNKK